MRASEVIREARSLLFERGWHQGTFYGGEEGPLCLESACNAALGARESEPLPSAIDDVLCEAIGGDDPVPWDWNDELERQFGEVIDVLDRAEKIAEQREAIA